MRFILENANIYATNLKYMNDSEEYTNGLKELRTVINDCFGNGTEIISQNQLEESIQRESDSYSISFSTERDLLSQWSMYAKESGVCLRMDFGESMIYRAYPEGENERSVVTKQQLCPQKVYYFTKDAMKSQAQYKKVRQEILDMMLIKAGSVAISDIKGNADLIWKETTPYVKRYEFKAEGEYRLVFNWPHLLGKIRIDYRNDKNVMKPYLDIECNGGWPVKEIIVGPGFNQDVVFNSIKHFLKHRTLKLPSITGEEFSKRCKKFLELDSVLPVEVNAEWTTMQKHLKTENVGLRYEAYENLLENIMNKNTVDTKYKEGLQGRFYSKQGIVLSKSKIPYIF